MQGWDWANDRDLLLLSKMERPKEVQWFEWKSKETLVAKKDVA